MSLSTFKVWVVAKREFLALVSTRSFWLGLLVPPAVGLLAILIGLASSGRQSAVAQRVLLLDDSRSLYEPLREIAAEKGLDVVSPEAYGTALSARKSWIAALERGELIAVVQVPNALLGNQPAHIWVENVTASSTRELDAALREAIQISRLLDVGLSRRQVEDLRRPIAITTERPTRRAGPGIASPLLDLLLPLITLILIMMGVMSGAVPLLQAVVEEKQQRVAEVLLGALSPLELMLGKLAGTTAAGTTVLCCNLGTASLTMIYFGLGSYIPTASLVVAAGISIVAMLLYGSLFLALGSASSELKEAQGLLMPVMLLFLAPMAALPNLTEAPHSSLSVVLSLFPLTAPLAMPVRLGVTQTVPNWQVALSIALVLLATALTIWSAGRVFRVGMLSQGRLPRFRQLLAWVVKG